MPYNKLTNEEKPVLTQLGRNTPARFIRANVRNVIDIYDKNVNTENIYQLSAEDRATLRELLRPMWSTWVAKADALGHPGQEILDEAVKLMDAYALN